MKTYAEKLRDPRWQKKRLEIFQRDHFTCRDCGSKENELHVHHCSYERNPWDVDIELLLCLCSDCHKARQAFEDICRRAVGLIMSKLPKPRLITFVEDVVKIANAAQEETEGGR